MENEWLARCEKFGVAPNVAREIYWNKVQGRRNSRYWSYCPSKVNMIDKKFLDESENLSDDCFEEKLVRNFTKKEMEFSIEEYWIEQVAEINPDAIVLEPRSTFNRAIIGMDMDGKLVYSATRIVKAFIVDEDGTEEGKLLNFLNTIR